MSNEQYFPKAIEWIEKQGFSEIKADFGDYTRPSNFNKSGEEQPYTPNITAKKSGNVYYIEIATKSSDITRNISKWQLLSTLTTMRGGKLFLLAPKGHKSFIEKVIEDNSLNAELLYLANL